MARRPDGLNEKLLATFKQVTARSRQRRTGAPTETDNRS